MSGLHFFDLPTELIIKTLAELSVVDLRSCEATNNRFLSGLIRDSASLQYGVEKQLACIEDTPHSRRTNSLADRAQNLRLRQRAWLEFSCTNTRTITVDHAAADPDLYRLVSDIYFLDGVPGSVLGLSTQIMYARIPQGPERDSAWEHLEIGRPVVDFAVAIDDFNLIAVATYTPHRSDSPGLSVDIVLLDFSTGEHHRLARKPVIRVHDVKTLRDVPQTAIEVAGDHLLLATVYADDATDLNMLHVFDWKSGTALMTVPTLEVGATFIAEDTILLPNGKGNSFDIYRVRNGEAAIIHTVHFPPLIPSYSIISVICEGSPSCLGSNSSWTRRRYTSDYEKSLIVVSFDIAMEDDDDGEFLFVFLRNEFMDILEDRHNAGHSSTEWPLWGPLLTRWLYLGGGTSDNMSYGRRFVWIPDQAGDAPQPIYALDFNPEAATQAQGYGHSLTATFRVVTRGEVTIIRYHAFQNPVISIWHIYCAIIKIQSK
ncbi:hypothetical protein DFH06DRAFT_1482867 [Mycena polygramma]|nr:hypothetical protein DFH06DRAFT_1482867 [Mycena polygramma]